MGRWIQDESPGGDSAVAAIEARLAALESDYRDMREMFFGRSRPWPEIVEQLRELEARINRRDS